MQTDRRTDSQRTSWRGVTARSAVRIPENGHSQEEAPGTTAENAASEMVQPAELASENAARPLSTPIVALYRDRVCGSSVTSTTRPSPLLSLHLPACEVVPLGEPGGERRNLTRVLAATMNGPWKDRLPASG